MFIRGAAKDGLSPFEVDAICICRLILYFTGTGKSKMKESSLAGLPKTDMLLFFYLIFCR